MAIVGDDSAMDLRVLSIVVVVNGECFESGCNQITQVESRLVPHHFSPYLSSTDEEPILIAGR